MYLGRKLTEDQCPAVPIMGSLAAASRSEAVMVAAGFNPRMTIAVTAWRRAATLEELKRSGLQPSLRDGWRGFAYRPWVKTHGYIHVVAPRRGLFPRFGS